MYKLASIIFKQNQFSLEFLINILHLVLYCNQFQVYKSEKNMLLYETSC